MHRSYLAVLTMLLISCAGPGVGLVSESPAQSQRSQMQKSAALQTDAMQRPQPLYTPGTADLLYVGNRGNNSVTVYHHDAHGDTAPLKVIAGSKTGIDSPGQLSEDPQGNLYVANGSDQKANSNPGILVFAHGASGNVAPIRKLNPAAGLVNIEAMTVDDSAGKIFAVEYSGVEGSFPELLRYPPNAAGNTLPFARGGITYPAVQLASDSTGLNLIEAHGGNSPNSEGFGVETLVKQFANNASPAVLYNTLWFLAAGLADDPTTKTYLAMLDGTPNGGIYRLAEDTIGNGPDSPGETFAPAPVSIISSETCGSQLALGYLRNIYVTHSKVVGRCSMDAVYVYTADASGKALPLRILSGKSTKLDEPYGIYEGQ